MTTTTERQTAILPCGHEVMIAYRDPAFRTGRLCFERLINLAGQHGTVTEHGVIYKATRGELESHLKFIFGVKTVSCLKTTLVA